MNEKCIQAATLRHWPTLTYPPILTYHAATSVAILESLVDSLFLDSIIKMNPNGGNFPQSRTIYFPGLA